MKKVLTAILAALLLIGSNVVTAGVFYNAGVHVVEKHYYSAEMLRQYQDEAYNRGYEDGQQQQAKEELAAEATPDSESTLSSDEKAEVVYITDTGEKYHRAGCRYLSRSQHEITKGEAIAKGYEPCSVCDP